ncbi:MAG: hypothetical protein AMXMBFR8_15790 [Nevskiales bacterium]
MDVYRSTLAGAVVIVGLCSSLPLAQAASIYVQPASGTVDLAAGQAVLEIYMDFSSDPTIGGGFDLDISGPASLDSFSPSAWFTTVPDPFLTGFGTDLADNDLEIHFGDFFGLEGPAKLGDLTLNLSGAGTASVVLSLNSYFSPFFDINNQEQAVALSGASVQIQAVPTPAAAWLLAGGLGFLWHVRERRARLLVG